MPTGYTIKLYEGKPQTVQEFILTCARAFGATIEQRDDPLDVPPRPREVRTECHDKALSDATWTLETAPMWTDEEASKLAHDVHSKSFNAWLESSAEQLARRRRYEAMLQEVDLWTPVEDLQKLKEFMLEQLRESIKFDCSPYDPPVAMTGVEYRQHVIDRAKRDMAYHTKERKAEMERVEWANRWIADLYASLAGLSLREPVDE
jgi:hypothetical protein